MNKLIFLILISISAHSYSPSLESILRNSSNAEIKNSTVAANLVISEINEAGEKINNNFLKVIYYKDDRNYFLTNVNYKNNFSSSSISGLHFYKDLSGDNFNKNINGNLFYSALEILLLNKPNYFLNRNKKYGIIIKSNKESINSNQNSLIYRYKEYLKLVKEDKDLENKLENPLSPQDLEQRKVINETMAQSYINHEDNISIIKKGNQFYWSYDANGLYIVVSNEKRTLNILKYVNNEEKVEMEFNDYILFNGSHLFPQKFIIRNQEKTYQVTLEKLQHFNETLDVYKKRINQYEEDIKKNKIDNLADIKPNFIL